jgi:chromatin segregation and condensation protein Rec8/ScpA/Scc1 (kleisin family)
MENIVPRPSEMQRSWGTSATDDKLGHSSGNVVTISSHPGWPGRHELHDQEAEGEIAADTIDLVRVFHEVLERVRRGPVLNMDDEAVTVGQTMDRLWRRFTLEDAPIRLSQIVRHTRSERGVICMQLALLELVRLQAISLRQDRNFADILVKRNSASGSQLLAPSF